MKNPSHPGELVKANLDELGINIADAAKALGITQQQLYNIVNGESAVSPEMAIRFEMAFGGSAYMWLRLQEAYDLAQARKHIENINVPPVARLHI
jgi:addiction module HigA family antidote